MERKRREEIKIHETWERQFRQVLSKLQLHGTPVRPVSAVGARGGILGGGEVVGRRVEGAAAVALEAPPESVDVVRVPEAGHKVRLRALQEADLIWKCGEEERRIHHKYTP